MTNSPQLFPYGALFQILIYYHRFFALSSYFGWDLLLTIDRTKPTTTPFQLLVRDRGGSTREEKQIYNSTPPSPYSPHTRMIPMDGNFIVPIYLWFLQEFE